ncbi:MAG: peptide MFS transporter [Bacteroidia bacterium]|nr:peptide MFS transporter [Bacteroidia bacterium]NND26593.1 peptide MFS transporter [Flavobacteriaceae bacterium]MBT8277751.1 peptide MFS transporter [Bacteroidia bacterium]NNK61435.1 peptide MFS transporter [Flavobacteriaceae bacterium]NNL33177.1 peptide MFS transporter [Flavobacteriaceae bacterium]
MTDSTSLNQKTLFGHPIGLYILFLTEMWERFSYYGMRAILVLYLVAETAADNPGLGWANDSAIALYGWYTMFVYVASIPGGIIADKLIGQRKSVFVGGLLLVAGHSILAVEEMWAFYTGLVLIVMGVGMLKPNISTMVGGLYPKNEQNRRDMGFYIFYMGINLGAAAAALIVGYVGEEYGWHYGFGLAGIGMALGQLTYWYGQKYLKHVGNLVEDTRSEEEKKESSNLLVSIFNHTNSIIGFTIMVLAGAAVWYFAGSWSYGLLIIGLAFAVGVGIVVYNDGNKVEKDRILVTYLSFLIIIIFWGAFEQAGGLMNLYAAQKTDLTIGSFEVKASWFQSVNAIFILIFATIVGSIWVWWKNRGKESSSLFKMAIGVIIMGWGFFFMSAASMQHESAGQSAMYWLVLAYLFHTIGELCASPVALSFITKLAPERWMAFMMGAYFAATGLGNKVAGLLGESASDVGDFAIFTGIAIFCTVFGILVILILKPLKRLTHGAEEREGTNNDEAEGFELADANN